MKSINKFSKACLVALLLLGVSLSAHAVSEKQRAEIDERTKPIGKVCLAGDNSCAAAVSTSSGAAKSGMDIYNTSCMACHSTGVAGAPKLGDVAVWTARLDKGIEQIYANAINGINAMPAKGTCMGCSDDEIQATVDYMVENSK